MKCLILVCFTGIAAGLWASDPETVAVVEFQNRSNSAVRYDGKEMAVWMANDLKRNKRFQPCDRKAVNKILKEAKWLDERLRAEDEARLRELPAKYALYGYLVDWRSSLTGSTRGGGISPGPWQKVGVNGVMVVFSFDLVNLNTGESVKSCKTEGTALAPSRGPGEPGGSLSDDLADFDDLFEETSKTAIRKAAAILSGKE